MYKFNFLTKINQEKLETKKRESFIRLLFICFTSVMIILLGLLYMFGVSVGNDNDYAKNSKKDIEDKIKKIRSEDFFSYKLRQNVYNSVLDRIKLTDILGSFQETMDSTVIITGFQYQDKYIELSFVSRSANVKSQLMSWIVNFKDNTEAILIKTGLCEKGNLKLISGPDIKKQLEDFTYWTFVLDCEFPVKKQDIKKGKK